MQILSLAVVNIYEGKTFYVPYFREPLYLFWNTVSLNISIIFVEWRNGKSFQHSPTAKRCSEVTWQCEFIYTTFLMQCNEIYLFVYLFNQNSLMLTTIENMPERLHKNCSWQKHAHKVAAIHFFVVWCFTYCNTRGKLLLMVLRERHISLTNFTVKFSRILG